MRAGKRVALPAPELPADVAVDVLGVELDRVEDEPGRLHDVVPDAVPGKPRDAVLAHVEALRAHELPARALRRME